MNPPNNISELNLRSNIMEREITSLRNLENNLNQELTPTQQIYYENRIRDLVNKLEDLQEENRQLLQTNREQSNKIISLEDELKSSKEKNKALGGLSQSLFNQAKEFLLD